MSSVPRRALLLRVALDNPVDGGLIGDDEFGEWIETARSERVIPLLLAAVRTGGQHLSPAKQQRAEAAQLDAMAVAVRLERHLLDVSARLGDAAITVAVLKGAATAHLDYEDPALRQFGDVDLLVHPEDFPRVCRVGVRRLASAICVASWA